MILESMTLHYQVVKLLVWSDLEKYDSGGMHKIYNKWPKIAKESYESDPAPVGLEL